MNAVSQLIDSVGFHLAEQRDRFTDWVFTEARQIHAVALLRILIGLSALSILWADFGNRGVIAGPGSVWVDEVRAISRFPEVGIMAGVSGDVVTVIYIFVIAAAVAFTVGWRTKTANVLLFIGYVAILGQNPLTGSAVDHLIRLTLLWMLLMDSGRVWSLDARRRGRGRVGRTDDVAASWLVTSLHNIGLIGLGIQIIVVYTSAGFDKLVHPLWRDGSALSYTLRLPENRPIEFLADIFVSLTFLGVVLTYAVLIMQVYFAPLLIHRTSRIAIIVFAAVLNLWLAVLFASLAESLALIAVTMIFLPDEIVWDRVGAFVYSGPVQRLVDVGYAAGDRVLVVVEWLRYEVLARIGDVWKYSIWYPVTDRIRAIFGR